MLLNNFLPDYEFSEVHSIIVKAPADRVFHAIKSVTPRETALLRALFVLRSLPALITGKGGLPFGSSQPLLEQMLASGFVLLAETCGEIAQGAMLTWCTLEHAKSAAEQKLAPLFDCTPTPLTSWHAATFAYTLSPSNDV